MCMYIHLYHMIQCASRSRRAGHRFGFSTHRLSVACAVIDLQFFFFSIHTHTRTTYVWRCAHTLLKETDNVLVLVVVFGTHHVEIRHWNVVHVHNWLFLLLLCTCASIVFTIFRFVSVAPKKKKQARERKSKKIIIIILNYYVPSLLFVVLLFSKKDWNESLSSAEWQCQSPSSPSSYVQRQQRLCRQVTLLSSYASYRAIICKWAPLSISMRSRSRACTNRSEWRLAITHCVVRTINLSKK